MSKFPLKNLTFSLGKTRYLDKQENIAVLIKISLENWVVQNFIKLKFPGSRPCLLIFCTSTGELYTKFEPG